MNQMKNHLTAQLAMKGIVAPHLFSRKRELTEDELDLVGGGGGPFSPVFTKVEYWQQTFDDQFTKTGG
jgi:hypothetical protein